MLQQLKSRRLPPNFQVIRIHMFSANTCTQSFRERKVCGLVEGFILLSPDVTLFACRRNNACANPQKKSLRYIKSGIHRLYWARNQNTFQVFREKEEITMKWTSLWVILALTLLSAFATTPVQADGIPPLQCSPDRPCGPGLGK